MSNPKEIKENFELFIGSATRRFEKFGSGQKMNGAVTPELHATENEASYTVPLVIKKEFLFSSSDGLQYPILPSVARPFQSAGGQEDDLADMDVTVTSRPRSEPMQMPVRLLLLFVYCFFIEVFAGVDLFFGVCYSVFFLFFCFIVVFVVVCYCSCIGFCLIW